MYSCYIIDFWSVPFFQRQTFCDKNMSNKQSYCIKFFLFLIPFMGSLQLGPVWAKDEPLGFFQEEKASLPKLTVFAYPSIRNSDEGLNNEPDRVMLAKVEDLLKIANVDYEIIILPWARIVRELSATPNSVIVSLGRTRDREDNFKWILSLRSVKLELISRRDKVLENLSKEQMIGGDYWALCDARAVQCKLLEDFGFSNNRIVKVADMTAVQKARIVERGRVDFMITEYKSLKKQMEAENLSAENLIPLMAFDQVDGFLASGLDINPTLLKKLHEAANTLKCLTQ